MGTKFGPVKNGTLDSLKAPTKAQLICDIFNGKQYNNEKNKKFSIIRFDSHTTARYTSLLVKTTLIVYNKQEPINNSLPINISLPNDKYLCLQIMF